MTASASLHWAEKGEQKCTVVEEIPQTSLVKRRNKLKHMFEESLATPQV